ncbi:MAG: LysR family transcriptional regulator [Oligoflexia bacterium]|nr:LysR family transcriptional regulator [Oligoflexia bacterium]
MPLSWDRVKTLVVLAETRSFSAAARKLGVSQPCVSRQIRQLEAELGTALVIRDAHRVNLTTAGRRLTEKLTAPFQSLEALWQETCEIPAKVHGPLSVGCLPEIGQSLFFDALLEFTRRHPALTLEVDYAESAWILERLRKGELQFGLLGFAPPSELLRSHRLLEERSALVTRKANRKALARRIGDSEPLPFVAYRSRDLLLHHYLKQFGTQLGVRKIEEKVIVNAHRSMIDALLSDDFYAIMPTHRIQDLLERGELVRAAEPVLKSSIYLVYHEANEWTPRDSAFKTYLLKEWKKKTC